MEGSRKTKLASCRGELQIKRDQGWLVDSLTVTVCRIKRGWLKKGGRGGDFEGGREGADIPMHTELYHDNLKNFFSKSSIIQCNHC